MMKLENYKYPVYTHGDLHSLQSVFTNALCFKCCLQIHDRLMNLGLATLTMNRIGNGEIEHTQCR